MANENLLYWDSSVFIDLIEETAARYELLSAIVRDAEQGRCRIITSALSLAEVSKLRNLGILPDFKEKKIVEFFGNDYISIRNVDRKHAELARAIIRTHNLKPIDALHVSTALLAKVEVMHTYDTNDLTPLDQKVRNPEGGPLLRIEEPKWEFQAQLGLAGAPPAVAPAQPPPAPPATQAI